jgi:hypothetical protein
MLTEFARSGIVLNIRVLGPLLGRIYRPYRYSGFAAGYDQPLCISVIDP